MSALARRRALSVPSGKSRVATKRRRRAVSDYLDQLAGLVIRITPERAALLQTLQFRSKFVVLLFGILFSVLLGRSAYLATNPFVRMQAALITSNTEPSSIGALVGHVQRLTNITRNIEGTSLGDIQKALDDTVRIANRAAVDFQAQYDAWSVLRGKIKNDSSTYADLRAQISEVQRLQEGEVVRLKAMLDAAQRPSIFADAFNLFISFVLGVLGSLFASAIYARWQATRSQ